MRDIQILWDLEDEPYGNVQYLAEHDVTREEFEVQAQLLLRTREKLDALEARVSALEARRSRSPTRKQV